MAVAGIGFTVSLFIADLAFGDAPVLESAAKLGVLAASLLAAALGSGQLAAIILRPVGTAAMLWLVARGAFGQLGEADNVISFGFDGMTVRRPRIFRSRRVKVATDGEIAWLEGPIHFRVSPEPLQLLKPVNPLSAAADDLL